MNLSHEIIGLCWVALILAWVILAMVFGRGGKPGGSLTTFGSRILFMIAIIIGLQYGDRLPFQPSGELAAEVAAAGAALCIAGLVFATWARLVLGRNWGMPMTVHEDPELVTSGPYRYVRHPIYTGLIAMWIGTTLVYPIVTPTSVAVIAYSVFSALREERDMEQRFPETYSEYRRGSKMLLPFLF